MRKVILSFFILLSSVSLYAQELNCKVQVITPQLQTADPKIFEDLQKAIFEFMNNRRWTGDVFSQQERIECSFLVNITKELSANKYSAQVTIQSNRPVFNASYASTMFNYVDKDWNFEYSQFQPLEFNENSTSTELTALLAYYAYIIIGLDYDSFSPKGGTPYFTKAQNIVNLNQNSENKGWKSYEGTRNRYWMAENFLNQKYDNIRQAVYKYHRDGLDKLYENPDNARKAITSSFGLLDKVQQEYPNSMLMQMFFSAKSDELANIYSKAPSTEKAATINILSRLDAANSQKYQGIMKDEK